MQFGNGKINSRRRRLRFGLGLTAVILLVSGCGNGQSGRVIPSEIEFRADGVLEFLRDDGSRIMRIAIEIAESDSAQARGLMDRRSLPSLGGMIFIDPASRERSFWMRNTPLPLDLLFIRSDSTIANIFKRTTPYSDDRINSVGEVQFVLEVRAGFTDRNGIEEGQRVRWTRQP